MTHHQGRLIMFDGPDGVGKTTQISLTAEALRKRGCSVYTTRTHGGTPMGELLRDVSFRHIERKNLTDHYISMAIHAELHSDVHTRRQQGDIVLVDRSPLSNWAYQVYGSSLSEPYAQDDIKRSVQLFDADLLLCYEAPLAILRAHTKARANASSEDYFESKPDSYFEKVIEGYTAASKLFGAKTIDATGGIEDVHDKTMEYVDAIVG